MVATCVAIVPSSPVSGHGLCVLCDVTPAADAPESAVAVEQMTELRNRGFRPKTVSGDKRLSHPRVRRGDPCAGGRASPRTQGPTEDVARAPDRSTRAQPDAAQAHRGDLGWAKTTGCLPRAATAASIARILNANTL